ncbi:MAG: chromate transporter [Clostridium sp.]|nr:chromate transporter [Clostridium sp.]
MKKAGILFWDFLKIGAFTFGGGYAMIHLLERQFVARRKWLDREEFLDMVAVAESTPGPVAVNSATYIGYKVDGVIGALSATVAVCLPSFVIIYLISLFLDQFLTLTYVAYAFKGIQACVVYLILSAAWKLWTSMEKNWMNVSILTAVGIAMISFSVFAVDVSSILYIIICGVIGIAVYGMKCMRKERNSAKEGKML